MPFGILGLFVVSGIVGNAPWHERAFAATWVLITCLVVFGSVYKTLTQRWIEWLKISPEEIQHGYSGCLAPKPATYQIGQKSELSFGRSRGFDSDSREVLTLQWVSSWGSEYRAEFGEWLSAQAKEQIFVAIRDFVQSSGNTLKLARW
jgi:hypothetical protein